MKPPLLSLPLLLLLLSPTTPTFTDPANGCFDPEAVSIFDYTLNGANWPGVCSCGLQQSPINIITADIRPDKPAEGLLGTPEAPIGELFRATLAYGNRIQVTPDGSEEDIFLEGGTIGVDSFRFAQFHTHTPSEHLVDGERAIMEIHFVYASSFGALSVVGFFVEIGVESEPFLMEIGEWLRENGVDSMGEEVFGDFLVEPGLPPTQGRGFWHYRGSLTTPPCTEQVDWHIFKEPLTISEEDYRTILSFKTDGNFREVQELNGRLVGYSGGAALGDMVDNVLQDDGDDDSDSGGGERRVGLGVFVFVVLREVMRNLF